MDIHLPNLERFTFTAEVADQTVLTAFLRLNGPTLRHITLEADLWLPAWGRNTFDDALERERISLPRLRSWQGPILFALSIRRHVPEPLSTVVFTAPPRDKDDSTARLGHAVNTALTSMGCPTSLLIVHTGSTSATDIVRALDSDLLVDMEELRLRYEPTGPHTRLRVCSS